VEFFGPADLPAEIAFQAHRRALTDWQRQPNRPSAPPIGDPKQT
jgi:hypothetical protein